MVANILECKNGSKHFGGSVEHPQDKWYDFICLLLYYFLFFSELGKCGTKVEINGKWLCWSCVD